MRVAVVGYGYWGPNVARNIAMSDATELTAVCDVAETSRMRAARSHPTARITPNYEEILADESIDGVVVALPIDLHHQFALAALEAGKHVMVEKPLARTVAECDQLIAAAEQRSLTLMAGHTFMFNGAVRAVRAYLDSGELGTPYYVSMRRTNLGIVRSDGNAMWSLAPHDLSILRYWLGRRPLTVSATGAAHLQDGIEDVVFVSITFEGGVVGHVHTSWLEPNKVRDATVVGDRKMVVYDDTAPEAKLRLYDKGIDKQILASQSPAGELGRYEDFSRFQMTVRAGDILIPKLDLAEPLSLQVEHFAACAAGETEPLADGHAGRWVVGLLEAAQHSLETGGAPQDLKEFAYA